MDRFRKLVKAVDEEAGYEPHTYLVDEYYDNGTFKPNVMIKQEETHMRMLDPTKTKYEVVDFNDPLEWKMITEQEFNSMKEQWTRLKDEKNQIQVQQSKKWIFDLIKNG